MVGFLLYNKLMHFPLSLWFSLMVNKWNCISNKWLYVMWYLLSDIFTLFILILMFNLLFVYIHSCICVWTTKALNKEINTFLKYKKYKKIYLKKILRHKIQTSMLSWFLLEWLFCLSICELHYIWVFLIFFLKWM